MEIVIPKLVIARDKCEKEPLDELFPHGVDIELKDLRPTGGDYTAIGLEEYVAIERKSLADLLGTLWGKSQLADGTFQPNLGRFAYELSKIGRYHFAYVAIEGTRDDLAARINWRERECRKFGKKQAVTYAKTMGLISSLQAEFGVTFVFFRDRSEMAAAIYADLYHCHRRFHGLSKSKIGKYEPSALNDAKSGESKPLSDDSSVQSDTDKPKNSTGASTFEPKSCG